jgi:hypothetical protein
MTAHRLAWSFCAVTVIGLAVALALPSAEEDEGIWSLVASLGFALSFAIVGALVASRRPDNPIGWIMCASGLAYAVGGVSVSYAESTLAGGDDDALRRAADWVSGWVWMLGIGPAVTFLPLLFPNGRLPSRRWRPVAWAAAVGLGVMALGLALPDAWKAAEVAAGVGGLFLVLSAIASIASLVFRFHRARRMERSQLKWLTYAAALVGVTVLAQIVAEATVGTSDEFSNTLISASIATLPVCIGIAMLRYRLYDIDVVINRTLVYGVLTATLAGAYVSSVLLLQLALSPLTEDSGLAIAGSTLAVAALVRPLRSRIQELVNRRFYRRRYDAARTLQGFGARLRDQVDLDRLRGELQGVVAETLQPSHVSVWLRERAR